MALIHVWKDEYYKTTASTLNYNVIISGETVYSGLAYQAPGDEYIYINVSEIARNYIKTYINIDYVLTGSTNFYSMNESTTRLQIYNIETDRIVYDNYFIWDYSYIDLIDYDTVSFPITGKYTPDMYKFNTLLGITNYFGVSFNRSAQSQFGYKTLGCGDYALYYINRFGGTDSFLIEGNVIEKDTYEVSTYTKKILPNSTLNEKNRYLNNITHSYELNTGWLNDSQSNNLARNLLSSNVVYLHDLKKDIIKPVNIINSDVDYKTFKTEQKLISYTINVEESNKQIIF